MSNSEFDMSLLDTSFDDMLDYVGFKPLPKGDYICVLGTEFTTVGDDNLPTIKVTFTVQEVIALADPEETAPEEGRKFNIMYILRDKEGKPTDWGEGKLKKEILTPVKDAIGGDKLSELVANADGAVVAVSLGIRRRKDKETGEIREENIIHSLAVAQ